MPRRHSRRTKMISAVSSASAGFIYASSPYAGGRLPASGAHAEQPGGTATDEPASAAASGGKGSEQLSQADQRRVDELKVTDRKVRAHEAAHVAAGGSLVTSGASFEYETGPDGQRYAVAGEVRIDTSEGRTPEETLARAEQIRAAALAPADPSPQDRSVAAAAAQMAATARAEIAQAQFEKASGGGEAESASPGGDGGKTSALPADAAAFGRAIARALSPSSTGNVVNAYA
jgi:hypothetical protein